MNLKFNSFVFATLIFFVTTLWGNMFYYLLPFLYSLFFLKKYDFGNSTLKILLIIILLSILNFIFNINTASNNSSFSRSILSIFPYSILFFVSYCIAIKINLSTLKWILIYIIIEIFFGIAEYINGTTTFFNVSLISDFDITDDLLYQRRSFGLSTNSSIFSIKILTGFFILFIIRNICNKSFLFITFFILLLGLFVSFNRTMIISVFSFVLLYSLFNIRNNKLYYILLVLFILIFFNIILFQGFFEKIIFQFTRGSDSTSYVLSNRDWIWTQYFNFIKDHFIFGNGSTKIWTAENWHAHNSYIMTLASNGIIIFILYLVLLFNGINKYTFPYLFSIFVSGFSQYTFFWGLSYFDIILLFILINKDEFKTYQLIKQKNNT